MRRAHRFRSRALVLCAAACVMPLTAQVAMSGTAGAAPVHAAPAVAGTAAVKKVTWLTDRRVELEVFSPASGSNQKVQLLLARDWNAKPDAKFPLLYMLDGLRAQDDENGWTKDARAESFFAEKNVNVVLPIGGQSSFYTDWQKPDNGKHYMWETFLIKELPPILEKQWRTSNVRGVEGLSMGGTSAMMLATRNPGFFKAAVSYSGFLQTTSMGMPQSLQYAQHDAGGFTTENMWGPPTDPDWAAHDPYVNADKLRGTAIYLSSGSGSTGAYDTPTDIPGVSTNTPGMGLEILSRLSTQNFATKLNQLNIPAQVAYRPSGTHSWPYWDFEMRQSWPLVSTALGVENAKPECKTGGAIGAALGANKWLGDCLTGEYKVAKDGIAQDFRFGRMVWSKDTGARALGGRIGGLYEAGGGSAGPLGLPTGGEKALPNGMGRFQTFQKGIIYWSPQTGAASVRGAIKDAYAKQGFEKGPLRLPTGEERKTPKKTGAVQAFQGGTMLFSPATGAHFVAGKIAEKYAANGWENGFLGFPKTNEIAIKDGGRVVVFEGGNIYWTPVTGAVVIKNGQIMDAYKEAGYEKGKLGYPTGDEHKIPGGVQQNFQFGVIKVVNGKVTVA